MAKPSSYWDRRAVRRLTDAEKTGDKYSKRIGKIYDKAYKNIQADIDDVYRSYSNDTGLDVQTLRTLLTKSETDKTWRELKAKGLDEYIKDNYKARITRLEQIQAQIYSKAKEIYPQEQLEHKRCYKSIINNSYYKTIYDTQMETGLDFAFSQIDDNVVKTLLNEGWSGKNYSKAALKKALNYAQRADANTNLLAKSLSEIIGGGMLSGQSLEKMSREIRERFGVAKYYSDRLVRTEVNHFNNEADAMAYEEMGMDKYVFLATLDTRTSSKCQELDNKVFELKDRQTGVNFPPIHPNCRSKTRAYMGEEIEATLKRRARNPVTGKNEVIGNMSYEEWYNSKVKEHGKDTIDDIYKKAQRASADKGQYEKYKKIIGKDIPTFDKFQDIKYNDSVKWENLKSYVRTSSRGESPPTMTFERYHNNLIGNDWEAVDFSPRRFEPHFNKHKAEFGDITLETYRENAIKLLNSDTDENILGFTSESGYVFRYDKVNNIFADAKPTGVIETYFKPVDYMKYWEDQIKKYGKKNV